MKQREESEQLRYNALKVARTAIRLKHAIAADNEINDRLPEIEARINELEMRGRAWELDPVALEVVES